MNIVKITKAKIICMIVANVWLLGLFHNFMLSKNINTYVETLNSDNFLYYVGCFMIGLCLNVVIMYSKLGEK